MAELNYDSFLPPSMTRCLRGRIFICRLHAAQASNLTGEVLEEFSAQRDEFSSAKLWVLPTKVDPIRLRRTMRDRPPFGFRRALMLTRLLIIAEKLLMYCSKKSPQLYLNRLLHTFFIDSPLIINEIMWENVWKRKRIDDFFTSEPKHTQIRK